MRTDLYSVAEHGSTDLRAAMKRVSNPIFGEGLPIEDQGDEIVRFQAVLPPGSNSVASDAMDTDKWRPKRISRDVEVKNERETTNKRRYTVAVYDWDFGR